jgi:predicted nucleotidyltransferase
VDRDSLVAVLTALQDSGARYLVVGGVAVVAHGYVRLTDDLDLVLHLEDRGEVLAALEALASLGYRPLVPVRLEDFADPALRASWVREKNARVFQLYSDQHSGLSIDLFLEEPFDFDRAAAVAKTLTLGRATVPIASLDDLIRMKQAAARPRDLDDVEHLQAIHSWVEDESG